MIDIHSHILSGVDDGSVDIEESVEMARIAWESGTTVIVATSHANVQGGFSPYQIDEYEYRLEVLRHALEKERIPIKVAAGMEIFATQDMTEGIRNQGLLSLNYSKYYLIEFDFEIGYDEMWNQIDYMLESGVYIPVIAHPERYTCVVENPSYLENLIRAGCCTQINRGSILGRFGSKIKTCAHELLQKELVTCVASDAHHRSQRTPYMKDVKEYLERHISITRTEEVLYANPLKILRNQNIKML